ncbi:uncharacterized protein LOC143242841 [Tachypleus tridentatus]|uniref:uncharacterized protein LOC143242841 n=1 Tax=Tachypleus tridentatus TaxID=6853 RepID=UPI003FD3699A
MPLITECEKKVPTKNVKKTKTNILRKQKVTKRTTLETIYENDLEERNTLIIQRYLNCYTFIHRIQRPYLPLKKLIYCTDVDGLTNEVGTPRPSEDIFSFFPSQ